MLVGIDEIVRNRLHADIVDGLVKGGDSALGRVDDRLRRAGRSRPVDHVDRVGLVHVECGRVDCRHIGRAVLHQRNRYLLAADGQLIVVERVLKLELEGDVLHRAAVVDDVDFVDRVRVKMEIVRAAVRVLQRQIVGDERHITAATRLVAVEHIEIGGVHLRQTGDKRRFAVARRLRRVSPRRDQGCGEQRGGERLRNWALQGFSRHGMAPRYIRRSMADGLEFARWPATGYPSRRRVRPALQRLAGPRPIYGEFRRMDAAARAPPG